MKVCTDATELRKIPKQITADMIPQGLELEIVRKRQSLIRRYYTWWVDRHPDKKVAINVNMVEAFKQSAKHKKRTGRKPVRK